MNPDQLIDDNSLSILERMLLADYFLSRGYLLSEIKELQSQLAAKLMIEACRYADFMLDAMEASDPFHIKFKLLNSLN